MWTKVHNIFQLKENVIPALLKIFLKLLLYVASNNIFYTFANVITNAYWIFTCIFSAPDLMQME